MSHLEKLFISAKFFEELFTEMVIYMDKEKHSMEN